MVNKTKVKAIIFDAEGVLYPIKDKYIDGYVAKKLAIPYETLIKLLSVHIKPLVRGEEDEKTFWHRFSKLIPNIKTPKESPFLLEYKKRLKLNKIIYSLLSRLKKNYQLILLSNTIESIGEYNYQIGMFKPFEKVFLSYEIKKAKPEKDAYLYVLKELKVLPEEVIFIDNEVPNIKSATQLGIHSIHYQNYKKLLIELRKVQII